MEHIGGNLSDCQAIVHYILYTHGLRTPATQRRFAVHLGVLLHSQKLYTIHYAVPYIYTTCYPAYYIQPPVHYIEIILQAIHHIVFTILLNYMIYSLCGSYVLSLGGGTVLFTLHCPGTIYYPVDL